MTRETVLVTGARGTVGNYVVSLAEAAGYRVIASDLSPRGVRVPVRGEVRAGDLRDERALKRLVRGCDHIIHTAAQLDVAADSAELTKTNTDAVVGLYEAARDEGARRFVHMSTATLYASGRGALTEESPLAPRGPYGMSKRGAEVFLRGQNPDAGPAWTVLRAAPIYGRRGRHFAASMLSLGPLIRLVSPRLPRLSGGPLATMVHAEDVARALLFVLERPDDTAGEVYNVSDGDVHPLGERLGLTFDAYGLKTTGFKKTPQRAFETIGKLFVKPGAWHASDITALTWWRLVVLRHRLKPALRPRLDRELCTLLYEDLVVDSTKLRALGWSPRFSGFAAGWSEVLRWYQAERWVPRYG